MVIVGYCEITGEEEIGAVGPFGNGHVCKQVWTNMRRSAKMEYQLVTYAMAVYDVSLLLLRSRAQVRRRHSTGGKFGGNAGCPRGTSPSNTPQTSLCGFSPRLAYPQGLDRCLSTRQTHWPSSELCAVLSEVSNCGARTAPSHLMHRASPQGIQQCSTHPGRYQWCSFPLWPTC